MVEVRNHLVEQVDKLSARPLALCAHCFYPRDEHIKFFLLKDRLVLYDAKVRKAAHVKRLLVREEFLEVLLPGRVAFEKVDGIFPGGFQLAHPRARLVLAPALIRLISAALKILDRDLAERDEVQVIVKLREEHVAVFSEQAAHQAQLAGFFGRDEIAAYVVRGGKRLPLLKAAAETVQERPVTERDVREAGSRDGHLKGTPRQEHLHDALGRAHHVHGVRRLVRGDAEIFFCAHIARLAHRLVGVEDVHVNHAHERVRVFFRADVLEREKVQDIVVPADPFCLRLYKIIEYISAAVDGERGELAVRVAHRRAYVAHQLDHIVLADVNDMEQPRVAGENLPRDGRTDRACAADDEEARCAHRPGKESFVRGDVALKQGRAPPDEGKDVVHSNVLF